MKALLFLAVMLVAEVVRGEPSVRVVRVAGRAEPSPVFHVWGGQPVDVSLEIIATDQDRPVTLRASIYQLADAIAAPLSVDLPVARDLSFKQSLARFENCKLPLPAVRHATGAQVRFAAQSGDGADWRLVGSARLVIYPADLGEQLKSLVTDAEKRGSGRLVAFGKSASLIAALKSLALPFDELGETLPDRMEESSTIYIGECAPADVKTATARLKPRGKMLLFVDDPDLLPGIYWTDRGGGFIAKVTLPLLADFAHAPERQAALFTLLQRALGAPLTTP